VHQRTTDVVVTLGNKRKVSLLKDWMQKYEVQSSLELPDAVAHSWTQVALCGTQSQHALAEIKELPEEQ
jgi:hypothetical protein